jgi:hypothetical protein
MIDVSSIVDVREIDGKEVNMHKESSPRITVCSHWNRDELVVLIVGEKSYTVNGDDLAAAIKNAQNSHRF